jgi:hypothetical protein
MAKKKAKARRGKVARRPSRPAKTRRPAKKAKRAVRRATPRRKPAPARRRAKATPARRSTPRAKATPVRRATPRPKAAPARRRAKATSVRRSTSRAKATPPKPVPVTPRLERARRRLPDVERAGEERRDERMLKAARSGHDDLVAKLRLHTETSPKLTAGDVDAKWEDAYAIGDEAPGGDNPTPDQDRVDDIGKALGVQYQDDQELMGGDEILERDEKRWELDPASSEDWPHDKDKDE